MPTLFAIVIGFYPAAFRAEFGDEMLGVLLQGWRDAQRQEHRRFFLFKHLGDLSLNAFIEHLRNAPTVSTRIRVRTTLRVLAFWMCFFHLLVGYSLVGQNIGWMAQVVFAWMLSVSCLLAVRYEFYGGIILITTAVVIGAIIGSVVMPLTTPLTGILSGLSYAIVFVVMGIGFVYLGVARWRKGKIMSLPKTKVIG
jgi:hypothetical protein